MVERDPNDDKNVIVEIQGGRRRRGGRPVGRRPLPDAHQATPSGAGSSTSRSRSATATTRSRSRATAPTRVFKYEGGTHRVQRVPETESQGRIHTSTATVAVLPEAEDVDVADRPERPADRRLPLVRPGRPVGQHDRLGGAHHAQADRRRRLDAGREDASCRTARRRCACCARACYERALAEQQAELAADRRAQVGTGERAEKIRTYNFPERRVTDHRVKLTVAQPRRRARGRARRVHRRRSRPTRSAGGSRRRPPASEARAAPSATRSTPRSIALTAAGCDTPRLDAELLLADALGVDRAALVLDPARRCSGAAARALGERVRRRGRRASRSPTSSGARASGTSTCSSTRAC